MPITADIMAENSALQEKTIVCDLDGIPRFVFDTDGVHMLGNPILPVTADFISQETIVYDRNDVPLFGFDTDGVPRFNTAGITIATQQHKCSYCGRLSEINQTDTLCKGCGAPLEKDNL